MTIGRNVRMCLGVLVVLLGMSASAAAQTNDEIFPNLQWNFSTPGARANAMGRAFIGMADDATATVSNPAGLVNLTKPQVYFEYKNTNLKVDRLAATDSLTTLVPTTFSTDINALSFFTISMPVGKRAAIGLTRHQFLNYQETFNLNARFIPGSGNFAFNPVSGNADFKGAEYGATVSVALTDQLNAGVTLALDTLSANSTATRNALVFGPSFPGNTNDVSGSPIFNNQTTINSNETAAAVSFGLLYKPSDKLSIGFNFVQGPKFTVQENETVNPGTNVTCTPTTSCGTQGTLTTATSPAGFASFPMTVHINVPNRIGVGIAARPNPRWLFALDIVRINYSSLADGFTPIFDNYDEVSSTNAQAQCTADPCIAKAALTGSEFSISDVTEMHFGAEYNLSTGSKPIFVRAGVFTNPDHRVRFNGFSSSTLPTAEVTLLNAAYNAQYNLLARSDDKRVTIGAGIVLSQQMQLDVAYVFGQEFIASTAIRFK
jgi:long-subunit fatty acid transport protein